LLPSQNVWTLKLSNTSTLKNAKNSGAYNLKIKKFSCLQFEDNANEVTAKVLTNSPYQKNKNGKRHGKIQM